MSVCWRTKPYGSSEKNFGKGGRDSSGNDTVRFTSDKPNGEMIDEHVFDAIIGNIMRPKALLDTNILVAGLSSQSGASFALLGNALQGRFELLASPALWLEYEAVLKRPSIVALHQLASSTVDDVLNALAGRVTPVQSHYLWRPQLRDPKDEMVLEAAINGQASHLVTLNVRDFIPAASHWRIELISPGSFLNLLETLP